PFVHNTFSIGGLSSLDAIQGALTLHAQGPSTIQGLSSIFILDSGAIGPHTYTVTEATVVRSGAAPITYLEAGRLDAAEFLDLATGAANDTVNVTGTALTPVELDLGNGNDTVTIGEGQFALDSIASPVTVVGGGGMDAIIVDDQTAAFGGNDYRVTS